MLPELRKNLNNLGFTIWDLRSKNKKARILNEILAFLF
jgi:hypothetical protein